MAKQVVDTMGQRVGHVVADQDLTLAHEIEADDDAWTTCTVSFRCRSWTTGRTAETAVDVTLLARYYERYADHAVSIARRVVYLVTGEYDDEAETSHEDSADAAQRST